MQNNQNSQTKLTIFRYQEYAKKLRTEAYAGSAACLAMPLTCPAVYAAAAIIVEKKIKDYKQEVDGLISEAQQVVASVTDMLEKINNKDEE